MRAISTAAVQYVRASTGLQGCSIEQQIAAIGAYAALRDFEIIATYSDQALSGLTLASRPALQRLIVDALAPGRNFAAVLIYDVSRWGRFQDIDHGAHLEFLCRRAGVTIHYCAEPFENDGSPEADLIKQIKRAIAAEFSRAMSERIKLAKRHINAKGLSANGSAPFGMQRLVLDPKGRKVTLLARGEIKVAANHRIVLTPGPPAAVETVKRIFRAYVVTGLKLSAIADLLNAEAAPSPSGAGWNVRRLRRVLRNEVYVGAHIFGMTRHVLGACVEHLPKERWGRVESAWPATIERWVFDKAQDLLSPSERRSDQQMLAELRQLLKRRGRLDTGLIDNTPGIRKACTYIKRFGSLAEAYRRVGYSPGRKP